MSCAHPQVHDQLVRRLVTQELGASAPEVVALTASCADCRARVQELTKLMRVLDATGEEERTVLVARPRQPPGDERVAAAIQTFLAHQRPRSPRRAAFVVLAAAALVIAAVFLRPGAPPRREPITMGHDALSHLAPSDAAGAYERFQWQFDLQNKSVVFDIVIFDAVSGAKVLEHNDLSETQWTPTPEDRARLPDAIRWEVRAHDGGGGFWARSARCWRSH